jgi:hypothetical protein
LALCKEWSAITGATHFVISKAVGVIVATMNIMMRKILQRVALFMNFPNHTVKQYWVMVYVFVFLFFSLGLLPAWAAYDMSYRNSPAADWWFGGIYTDYVADFFDDVIGFLLEVYRIQICFPIIEFTMQATIRTLKRCVDQRKIWPNDIMQTSSPTMAILFEKYLGPPFFIDYKYSYILTYVFVAFTWGSVVPMIFWMSTLGILIMYTVEKLMVYYAYVFIPMIDHSMFDGALKLLYIAPFFLFMNAAWAFSNREIYHDEI